MAKLTDLSLQLSRAAGMKTDFVPTLSHHRVLPSDNLALVVLGNLDLLLDSVQSKIRSLELSWGKFLDDHPQKANSLLNSLINEMRAAPEEFWKALRTISFHDYSTLGPGRWLNDEILNYFIEKWCKGSRTLGFGTFFAGSCLFEDKNTCLQAKRCLTGEDEERVFRCVKRRLEMLSLDSWDAVFIPIHEASSHWYSVRIDFKLKRIDIFDSLRDTCISNRQKPVPLRKNSNLMLVLMWLAEILGSIRGEDVCLTNNPLTSWRCDPHSKVPFQPNTFDCGVHTLWHLKHILQYREITLGKRSAEDGLLFTQDMAGKRLRLAQELLHDGKARKI
ncbi:hypothetical protein F5878DRAFT_667781 [Lentinula raphanica]|uniref:Ubiquitin-like protease family profile domain-containing protein n=1 Tax=Lentinula raphanica TaxID=153919 RepID=A0AA38U2J8_9AGAR|nr:hypothetical protein F5878DRAFT_667781 [Lentinula raphanica]